MNVRTGNTHVLIRALVRAAFLHVGVRHVEFVVEVLQNLCATNRAPNLVQCALFVQILCTELRHSLGNYGRVHLLVWVLNCYFAGVKSEKLSTSIRHFISFALLAPAQWLV